MNANRNDQRARIVMPDNPPPPATCVTCHRPIAVLIAASTPRNPRRHIVQVPTAYVRTAAGPVCPRCWEAAAEERRLVADVADAYEELLTPVRLPDAMPAQLLRIYTRNGRVVRTEPLDEEAGAADARTAARRNGAGR